MKDIEKLLIEYFEEDRNKEILKYLLSPNIGKFLKLYDNGPDIDAMDKLYPLLIKVGKKNDIQPIDISNFPSSKDPIDTKITDVDEGGINQTIHKCCCIVNELTSIVEQKANNIR